MPLDYGLQPGTNDVLNRYWIWDPANTAGTNPLGLSPDQIVNVQVLGRNFSPSQLPLGTRTWNVVRDWQTSAELRNSAKPIGAPRAVVR